MAQQTVNIGATANDDTGDTLRAGGQKINANFTELYGRLADQVSGAEITAGTETELRSYSPADIVAIVDAHGAGGGGADDQTAAEVPITDAGDYYTGTEVEAALQEVGAEMALKPAAASVAGVVLHGSTAETARPSGYAVVIWIGSVEPTNALDNDLYFPTA